VVLLAAVSHGNSKVGSDLGPTFKNKVATRMTLEDQQKSVIWLRRVDLVNAVNERNLIWLL
jgi:hypothetical protein